VYVKYLLNSALILQSSNLLKSSKFFSALYHIINQKKFAHFKNSSEA